MEQPLKDKPSKRDKSASKHLPEKRENIDGKLKSFERDSEDDEDERQSDKKKEKKGMLPLSFPNNPKDIGIIGQLVLKPNKKETAPITKVDKDKERDKTTEKNSGILDLNLKGKNILLPTINTKKRKVWRWLFDGILYVITYYIFSNAP